jgi:nucleoside phosphorylase
MTSDDYTIGIICALSTELKAVRLLFDASHGGISVPRYDQNAYVFGSMCKHNVVSTCLPEGEYGTNPAADVASNMKRSFPHLRICLLVGIGGGVPSQNDIRLGDVVVSKRQGANPGVLPYDMEKALDKGVFQINGCLDSAPRRVRSVLSEMQSDPALTKDPLKDYLQHIEDLDEEYRYPGAGNDTLYMPSYPHPVGERTCTNCSRDNEQQRPRRQSSQPVIHYGTIASGNKVIRDAATRDRWGEEHNVLCFEMEAAGIMNTLPSLIIRGICDYCDSHKNKLWQKYAAASAAAFAKLLLSHIRPESEE